MCYLVCGMMHIKETKGSREEPEMSHLQNCGHRRFFQSTVRTSPVFPWDSLSSTASSGGLSRFFPRNISRMETMGCKQAPHAVNSGTEMLWHLRFFPWTLQTLLLIGKSSPCGGSWFHLSLSNWSFTICLTPFSYWGLKVQLLFTMLF